MKLLCISDTHGKHEELDLSEYDADVLIHAGDWTAGTKNQDIENINFLEWLEKQPFEHKILIAGNHELDVESNPELFKKQLSITPSVIYLENSSTTIDGIKFYGSPYSNEFCGWAFMEYEHGLEPIWKNIDDDTNVLITHGPAFGCLDMVNNDWNPMPNVGSKTLSDRKKELKDLKIHVSGHIHEAYGVFKQDGITNVCASILNEKYKLVNNPILIEI